MEDDVGGCDGGKFGECGRRNNCGGQGGENGGKEGSREGKTGGEKKCSESGKG